MDKDKKVALYSRVSTYEQAKRGYSLPAQQELLRDYAERNDLHIVDEYVEDGMSGASLNRPALQRLLKDVDNGKIDKVIVYKQDRLSRSTKNTIQLIEHLVDKNVELISLNENIDWKSPMGRAMLKMMATFSEMERENIMERSMMGKEKKAQMGLYSNRKKLPVGYKWDADSGTLVPDEIESQQVKKIFEMYLEGHNIRQIWLFMQQNYVNQYSSYSTETSCRRILYNPIYAGYFRHNDELIKGKNIIPIIELETYLAAENIFSKNRAARTRSDSPYLLTGLLWCGECGQRYQAKRFDHKSEGKNYLYYRYGCAARLRFDSVYHSARCVDSPLINSATLEEEVIERIKKAEFSQTSTQVDTLTINIIVDENEAIKTKINKLLDLYEGGIIDKNSLEERILTYNKTLEQNKFKINEISEQIKERPTVSFDTIQAKIADLGNLEFSEKRNFIKALVKKIIIHKNNIEILYNI